MPGVRSLGRKRVHRTSLTIVQVDAVLPADTGAPWCAAGRIAVGNQAGKLSLAGLDELELRIESVSRVVAYQRTPTLRNSPFRSGRYVSSVS